MTLIAYLRAALTLGLLLLLLTPTAQAQNKPSPPKTSADLFPPMWQFTLRYDPPRILAPLVRVRINQGETVNFVLDTGAGYPVIVTEEFARRVKLPLFKDKVAVNQTAQLTQARIESLHLVQTNGDTIPVYGPMDVLVEDGSVSVLAPGEKVAGIIGVGLFAKLPAKLNFRAQTLTIYSSGIAFTPPSVTPLPLNFNDSGTLDVEVSFTASLKARMALDTGAFRSSLDETVLAKLPQSDSRSVAAGLLQGVYFMEAVNVSAFPIAGASIRDVRVESVPNPWKEEFGNLLGMEVLQHFRITFDVPNQKMYLETNQDPRFERARNDSGASIAKIAGEMRVQRVEKESPAAKAGLQTGDEIVSVDGITAADEMPFAMERVLNGVVGEDARVEIKRGEASQTFNFKRTGTFESPTKKDWQEGLIGRILTGNSLDVLSLKSDAPLRRVGVVAGEQIIAVNDKIISRLDVEDVGNLLVEPLVTLVVRGKDGKERTLKATTPAPQKKRPAGPPPKRKPTAPLRSH